jgi:hypothetical protein
VSWDSCLRSVGVFLLVKLASSGVRALMTGSGEASGEMAGKLAPGRQSGHGVNAETGVRQVARSGGPLPSVPHAQLGGRAVTADAVDTKAG